MSELKQLIENSKVNEAIAEKMFEIETEILSCHSSDQLLQSLLTLIQQKFALSDIHLLLCNPLPIKYHEAHIHLSSWVAQHTTQVSSEVLAELHQTNQPILSTQVSQYQSLLPATLLQQAKSVAFIPVMIENQLVASLIFADKNPIRFNPQLGTYHLQRLGVRVSLCLSNVLVREQLEYMANYDRLTGVGNRRLMEQNIEQELNRLQRYQTPFSILFIDCNKFKQINDTYGHACGDEVLSYVAKNISQLIRGNDRCFRYAGDEFVVTLSNQNIEDALIVAKRLTEFFSQQTMDYQDHEIAVTISCGAASGEKTSTIDELLKQADERLYLHKNNMLSYASL